MLLLMTILFDNEIINNKLSLSSSLYYYKHKNKVIKDCLNKNTFLFMLLFIINVNATKTSAVGAEATTAPTLFNFNNYDDNNKVFKVNYKQELTDINVSVAVNSSQLLFLKNLSQHIDKAYQHNSSPKDNTFQASHTDGSTDNTIKILRFNNDLSLINDDDKADKTIGNIPLNNNQFLISEHNLSSSDKLFINNLSDNTDEEIADSTDITINTLQLNEKRFLKTKNNLSHVDNGDKLSINNLSHNTDEEIADSTHKTIATLRLNDKLLLINKHNLSITDNSDKLNTDEDIADSTDKTIETIRSNDKLLLIKQPHLSHPDNTDEEIADATDKVINKKKLLQIDKLFLRTKSNLSLSDNALDRIELYDTISEKTFVRSKRNISSVNDNTYDLYDNDTLTKNISSRDNIDWLSNDEYYNESDYDDECFSLACMPYEDYVDRIRQEVINPSVPEWIFVGAHSIVFLVGLIGNALVCVAVYRNHSMRTVTNYFIVNLAVADFMVILFCLPPTLIWDITSTWFFGIIMCKVVLYLQNVSVTVSVLTLTFISIDRWYAICHPLKFKSTTGRAKTAIIVIWFIALSTDIPELIMLTTVKPANLNITEVFFTQCDVQWDTETDTIWNISKTFILYIIPLVFMSFAYCQIVRVLWRTDKVLVHNSNINNSSSNNDPHHHPQHHHPHHSHHHTQRYHPPTGSSSTGGGGSRGGHHDNGNTRGLTCNSRRSTFLMNSNTTTEGQLRSRRKAAKMLVAVVVMFAVCYFPVHFFNIIRQLIVLEQTDCNAVLVLLAHWLIYANSAINPVIYNFMSGKFRKEFHTTFGCWCFRQRRFNRRRQTTMTRSSTYICRFTTGGGSTNAKTEVIPLSNLPHSIVRRESDY